MDYPVTIDGVDNGRVTLAMGGLVPNPKLLLDGKPLAAGTDGLFRVPRKKGTDAIITVKTSFFDPLPAITVDQTPVVLAPPLAWYEWLWAASPFGLAIIGGVIGGMMGALAAYVNISIFRSNRPQIEKYLFSAGVSFAVFMVWIFIVVALMALFAPETA